MTSVGEVKLALERSCELLRDAYSSVRTAQTALDEALEVLDAVGAQHHESLTPPGFLKAKEGFADELELIAGSLELVQRLSVEL